MLHRVIGVAAGHYLIRGDNTYSVETVPDSAVIGVLTSFQRKGIQHDVSDRSYQLYVYFWDVIYPLRHVCFRLRHFTVRTARKLGILPFLKKMLCARFVSR